MIEKLMNEELRYGEPEFSKAESQIEEIWKKLADRLDAEGLHLLNDLSNMYIHQSNMMVKDSFHAGFCTAVNLILDCLRYNC